MNCMCPTTEVRSSIPVISKFNLYILSNVLKRLKLIKERPGMAHFLKKMIQLYTSNIDVSYDLKLLLHWLVACTYCSLINIPLTRSTHFISISTYLGTIITSVTRFGKILPHWKIGCLLPGKTIRVSNWIDSCYNIIS